MTNQQMLAELSPEKCYDLLYYIFYHYVYNFTDSRQGIIQWLTQEAKISDGAHMTES